MTDIQAICVAAVIIAFFAWLAWFDWLHKDDGPPEPKYKLPKRQEWKL